MKHFLRGLDIGILDVFNRFRAMERGDIKRLFFSDLEVPLVACNRVLPKQKNKGLLIAENQGLNENYFIPRTQDALAVGLRS